MLTSLNGLLYVVGDYDNSGGEFEGVVEKPGQFNCFNLTTREWTSPKSMNFPRHACGAVSCYNEIWCLGGIDSLEPLDGDDELKMVKSMEVYCPIHDKWAKLSGDFPDLGLNCLGFLVCRSDVLSLVK